MMTNTERVQAVIEFGFTERQARFLVLVMRHAGVCVPRQYARFAGTAQGGKCSVLFERLARRGHARTYECVHNRARLYHVDDRALYHAIGEPTSRYGRQVSPRVAVERLMLLDAVLATPAVEWLTTKSEKLAHLANLTAATGAPATHGVESEGASRPSVELPTAFPLAVDADGRTILLYLAMEPWTDRFRRFLQAHVPLLMVAPTWTIRIVFPGPLDRAYAAYQVVVREELESPLHHGRIRELEWYFKHRKDASVEPLHPLEEEFMKVAAQQCRTGRFGALYRRWLRHGQAAFVALSSAATAEALKNGQGHVERLVLEHPYSHLSPLVTHHDGDVRIGNRGREGAGDVPVL